MLFTIGFAIASLGLVVLIAIAIPSGYRFGIWQRFPELDHRLLPHVSAVFAAAFGAFFGSLSAFYLGRVQQRDDRREKRHASLIAAQYALMSQWNIIEGIRVQHLEQFRSDPNRFAKLALFYSRGTPVFVPFSELTFVLETDNPNVLNEIHLAEQSYQTCVDALALRNQQLERFYQSPRVSHHILNFQTSEGITEATKEDFFLVKEATEALYTAVDRALPRLAAAAQQLEKLITRIFPGMQALKMTATTPVPRQ